MTQKINISIPQPCHENWEAMTAMDKGKFCASCQKKVFDFTNSSDREIISAFDKNQNLCGRFLDTQLNRDLVKPKEKTTLWLATTTALISLVGLNEATAQEPVKTEQTERHVLLGKPAPPKPQEIEVSGVVLDDQNIPLPGANISVKGKSIFAQTDFDGKYTIKANKDDILVISYTGFKSLEINIINENVINSKLEIDSTINAMTVGMIITPKKRTFLGRLFHKSKYRYD
ncbi:carboxypeptidase-like regulatory domain-containing protein [Flavobacterium sp.]|uniref:carboxypeptidase-like regulatory domain-containing protein n=1 Tax=Flavobacterium sp. TaxID=239 RepID=UPI002FD8BDEF